MLALLQLLSLLAAGSSVLAAMAVWHHLSWNVFVPFWTFCAGWRPAVPVVLTYLMRLFMRLLSPNSTAGRILDPFKWLKNVFFQQPALMAAFLAASTALVLASGAIVKWTTPPAHAALTEKLLNGENDLGALSSGAALLPYAAFRSAVLSEVAPRDSEAAEALSTVAEIFVARWQSSVGQRDKAEPKFVPLFQRINEFHRRPGRSPFVSMGLGEACSLVGNWKGASDAYLEVASGVAGPTTAALRHAAYKNAANALLYEKRYAEAARAYSVIPETIGRNSNLVAALFLSGDPTAADALATHTLSTLAASERTLYHEHYVGLLMNRCQVRNIAGMSGDTEDCELAVSESKNDMNLRALMALVHLSHEREADASLHLAFDSDDTCLNVAQAMMLERRGDAKAASLHLMVALGRKVAPGSPFLPPLSQLKEKVCADIERICGPGMRSMKPIAQDLCSPSPGE